MSQQLTVVKLGGSHAFSPLLGNWLRAIAAVAGPVVVVPGGGPFAEAVRAAQPAMGFDDAAAHDMALMGMAQFGRALVGLAGGLVFAPDLDSIRAAISLGHVPVWSPWPMLRLHPDIKPSWDITSDSLAVWLATALGAARVVLIKHRAAPDAGPVSYDLAALVRDGMVDAAFPRFAARFAGQVHIAGPDDLDGNWLGRRSAAMA